MKPVISLEWQRSGALLTGLALIGIALAGCQKNQPPEEPSASSPSQSQATQTDQWQAGNQSGSSLSPPKSADHVQVNFENAPDPWQAGTEQELELVLSIEKGWHVNANPATFDYLIPTELSLKQPSGASLVSIDYPEGSPYRIAQLEEPIQVYEGTVRIPVRIKLSADLEPGAQTIQGQVSIQACDDQTCLAPSEMTVELPINISS